MFNGCIVEEKLYEQLSYNKEKNDFIYDGLSEEDLLRFPEEAQEEIQRRERIWQEQHEKRKNK